MSSRPSRSTIPQRGHLYWGQVPYLPERPLDVMTIDKKLLQNHIGALPAPKIAELNARLAMALGLVTPP